LTFILVWRNKILIVHAYYAVFLERFIVY
jgi:hypothetical protein